MLYWMSTSKLPPSAGIFVTDPTVIVDLASCFTATEADRPSLWKVMLPVVSDAVPAGAAVTVTVPSPSPESGETVRPVPLTETVQA